LAKRGFVVLAIDSYCFGERKRARTGGPAEKGGMRDVSQQVQSLGGTHLMGMILRDDLMALDYLAARREVDAERIGVMGMSMGAQRAWWLMALDERLQTACHLLPHAPTESDGARIAQGHGIYYYVPNLLNHFDTEALWR